MNKQEADVLSVLLLEPYINQRILSELCGHSLGVVNRSIKNLRRENYLDDHIMLTSKAIHEFKDKTPKNAVILAAGFGMRMVPINTETPKGLLEVNGEPLIERIIKQLHEVGIEEIYVIVGFMKEQYEYLIDEYGVELIVNKNYAAKNNLHSLKLALPYLYNTYIVPCDIWCNKNPFHSCELYSWYMVSDIIDKESSVRVNRKKELVAVPENRAGNTMIGIAYLLKEQAEIIKRRVEILSKDSRYDDSFWEEALYGKDRMIVQARVVHGTDVVEINTYEQLRELDSNSNHLKSDAVEIIEKALGVKQSEITDITVLKKGMTNRSFRFNACGKKYIMRIPGEGTDQLINRKEEAAVYRVIKDKNICDNVIYIDPDNGYKITEFLDGARVCDPLNVDDLKECMKRLRNFHEMRLRVDHRFDIFAQILFYESLWEGRPSVYKDYKKTRDDVLSLQSYTDEHKGEEVLAHIDAVPDNFLFLESKSAVHGGHNRKDNGTDIRIIDWEYAGMQDPHIDIAMFCIYALYNRRQVDSLINIYFEDNCPDEIRVKIYCYVAAGGLLWSNWCEYKRSLGVEFGEYSLCQYRYAKDYYRIAMDEINKYDKQKGDGEE